MSRLAHGLAGIAAIVGATASAALFLLAPAAAQQTETVTVRTDNPAVTVTAITILGQPVAATGLGTASAQFQLTGDEEGIECETFDLSISTSDRGYYRPLANLCQDGWVVTVPTTLPAPPANLPGIDPELSWTTASTRLGADESGDDSFLVYGIPETDATAISAVCRSGSGRIRISLDGWPIGFRDVGQVIQALFIANDRVLRYEGRGLDSESSEQNRRVEIEVQTIDPLWTAMVVDYEGLYVAVAGTNIRPVPTKVGAQPITDFVNRCHGA